MNLACGTYTLFVLTLGLAASPRFTAGQSGVQSESPYTASTHERIHYGLKASLNLNFSQFAVAHNPALDAEPSLGWSIAGLASYRFNTRYGIKAEMGYTYARSKYTYDSASYVNQLNLHLLDLHVLANRRFLIGRGSRPTELYLGIGPILSYWISSDGTVTSTASTLDYTVVFGEPAAGTNTLYAQAANRWLFGAELSVGTMIPITRTQRLLIELRGSLGLTTLMQAPAVWAPAGSPMNENPYLLNQRIHAASLSASYVFAYNLMHARLGKSNKDKTVKKRDPRKQKKDKSYLNTRIKSGKKN